MHEKALLVKLYDLNKVNLGKGNLLSLKNNTIIVKGNNLPVLNSDHVIMVNIYDERIGISPYMCRVSVASKNQLTAQIIRRDSIIERRTTLKVRTDLSFYTNKLYRNSEDITDEIQIIKINILNLSIGGMLISSNFKFLVGDVFTFYFKYINYKPIHIEAKIIRIDEAEIEDENRVIPNYGCIFMGISSYEESILLKYLFERQLQLYRNK